MSIYIKGTHKTICCFYSSILNDDDCWGFNVPFNIFSAISVQPPIFFNVLSMIESMGVRTTEPRHLQL